MSTNAPAILSTRISKPIEIKPVHNYMLIKRLDDETNLIHLPDGVTNPLQQWEIMDVSPETTVVKKGDRVLLVPGVRVVQIDGQQGIGMAHDNSVIGIVS